MLNIINEFERDKYFKKEYPKSLDVSYFKKYLNKNYFKKMTHEDVMANLLAFTVKSISIGISQLPKPVSEIIVFGGGMYNNELIKKFRNCSWWAVPAFNFGTALSFSNRERGEATLSPRFLLFGITNYTNIQRPFYR